MTYTDMGLTFTTTGTEPEGTTTSGYIYTPPLAAGPARLDAYKPFIEYLQQFNVKRVSIDGIEIEFDPHLSLLKASAAQDLEEVPVAERMNQVRKTMEEITKEQNDEMFWSTGK